VVVVRSLPLLIGMLSALATNSSTDEALFPSFTSTTTSTFKLWSASLAVLRVIDPLVSVELVK
jgi:hypothetical protein